MKKIASLFIDDEGVIWAYYLGGREGYGNAGSESEEVILSILKPILKEAKENASDKLDRGE